MRFTGGGEDNTRKEEESAAEDSYSFTVSTSTETDAVSRQVGASGRHLLPAYPCGCVDAIVLQGGYSELRV